jgi:hypothetical protein
VFASKQIIAGTLTPMDVTEHNLFLASYSLTIWCLHSRKSRVRLWNITAVFPRGGIMARETQIMGRLRSFEFDLLQSRK